eukprot:gene12727-biopygen9344
MAELQKVVKEMKELYNGYHFSEDCETSCYNPYGLVSAFMNKEFGHYWAQSFDGCSSELIRRLREAEREKMQEDVVYANEMLYTTVFTGEPHENHVAALLQSGYLTIAKHSDQNVSDETIVLHLSDGELRQAYSLLCYMAWKRINEEKAWYERRQIHDTLSNGDVRNIMAAVGSFLHEEPQPSGRYSREERALAADQDRPRDAWKEDRFGGYLRMLLFGGSTRVIPEHSVVTGRVDMEVEAGRYKYIFELKVKELSTQDTALTALKQAKVYVSCPPEPGFTTVTVGIVFSQWTDPVSHGQPQQLIDLSILTHHPKAGASRWIQGYLIERSFQVEETCTLATDVGQVRGHVPKRHVRNIILALVLGLRPCDETPTLSRGLVLVNAKRVHPRSRRSIVCHANNPTPQ